MKIIALFLVIIGTVSMYAQTETMFPLEKLTRGLVALPSENGGQFISWRLFGTDPRSTTFDLLRDGEEIARNLGNRTNYIDPQGTNQSQYQIIVKEYGEIVEITDAIKPWTNYFKNIQLDRPSGGIYPTKQDNSFVHIPRVYKVILWYREKIAIMWYH